MLQVEQPSLAHQRKVEAAEPQMVHPLETVLPIINELLIEGGNELRLLHDYKTEIQLRREIVRLLLEIGPTTVRQ